MIVTVGETTPLGNLARPKEHTDDRLLWKVIVSQSPILHVFTALLRLLRLGPL